MFSVHPAKPADGPAKEPEDQGDQSTVAHLPMPLTRSNLFKFFVKKTIRMIETTAQFVLVASIRWV